MTLKSLLNCLLAPPKKKKRTWKEILKLPEVMAFLMPSRSLGFEVGSISTRSNNPSNWSRMSRARFILLTYIQQWWCSSERFISNHAFQLTDQTGFFLDPANSNYLLDYIYKGYSTFTGRLQIEREQQHGWQKHCRQAKKPKQGRKKKECYVCPRNAQEAYGRKEG